MKAPAPLLSIGMIVKNEKRCLGRCLEALAPLRAALPCELVIADTGSADNTKEIAARHADILFDFAWCDDFSAARNAVMDRCSGQWFLTVDADEYLDPDFSELVEFLTSPKSAAYNMASIMVRNHESADITGGGYEDFSAMRMVRMSTGMRYEGLIHETWPKVVAEEMTILRRVLLHHDGYGKEGQEEKEKRNMSLLEKELARDPRSMRRVVQCLESSYNRELSLKYGRMTAEMAATHKHSDMKYWAAVGLRDAAARAYHYDLPEFEPWVKEARELFPWSLCIGVDLPYLCAHRFLGRGDYAAALEECERYWKWTRRHDNGRFDSLELLFSGPSNGAQRARERMLFVQALCSIKLRRWEGAQRALEKIRLSPTTEEEILRQFIESIVALWKGTDTVDPSPILAREWNNLDMGADTKEAEKFRSFFLPLCAAALGEKQAAGQCRETWRLFAVLGDGCDIGRAALAAGACSAEEAEERLAAVEDWQLVPPEVLARALRLGARLPDSFFRSKPERISGCALGLVRHLAGGLDALLQWPEFTAEDPAPGRVFWRFQLAAAAAGALDWKNGAARREWCGAFCKHAEAYIKTFYNPAILREDAVHLLPEPAYFGWHMARAYAAVAAGDTADCVRRLRTALRAFPGMGNMISFLLAEAQNAAQRRSAPSGEMLALAQKVRAILSQYPEDHPAVAAIRASEAYRQVAYLIES